MMDARTLTMALGGRWYQRYGQALCPAHDNTRTPALTLADGDDGRLLAHCKAGCDFANVMAALRAQGLVEGRGSIPGTRRPSLTTAREADVVKARKRVAQAQRLWREARPIAGTLAEAYLRRRGITCLLAETLRFHPECWHLAARRLPAMVARVDGVERFAVHRTYLAADGIGKAGVDPSKAMLGRCAGGAVRLSDGPGALLVGEGIESTLSALRLLQRPGLRARAALSTSGMKSLRLPATPGELIVASDGDAPGREAARILAERATAASWQVSIADPGGPDGYDWNDVLKEREAAA